jgi:multidrug resistance efflux pump
MTKKIILAVAVGVFAGVVGRVALRADARPAGGEAAPGGGGAAEVVSANGTVEGARPEVALRPEVAGTLTAVYARENAVVTAGQVVAELSNAAQKAQVALAEAELAVALQSLKKLEAGERAPVIRRALAEVESRERASRFARADWDRAERSARGISAGDLDAARTRLDLARADLDKARAELALLEEGSRSEDVAAARAQVQVHEAKLHAAEAGLAKTRLRAPSGGRVLQVLTEPGEMASPTSPQPVLIMADLSRRRVRAFVEEYDVARVAVGQAATVTADGLPGQSFPGRVAVVLPRMGKRAPQSDAAAEMKDVYYREVLIDLAGGEELPLNLRVQVRIEAGERAPR